MNAIAELIDDRDFAAQCRYVLTSLHVALRSAGTDWPNVVQFTTYLVHSQSTLTFMDLRLREFPKMLPAKRYPPNTLLIIDRRVNEKFLIEVQTVAAL